MTYSCPKCGLPMICVSTASFPAYITYYCNCGYTSKTVSEPVMQMTLPKELQEEEAGEDGQEDLRMMDTRDEWNEQWMWGLFAIVLHRRYKFTSSKLAEIFGEIQALHNEIYDDTLDYEEVDRIVKQMVQDEIGMDIDSVNL